MKRLLCVILIGSLSTQLVSAQASKNRKEEKVSEPVTVSSTSVTVEVSSDTVTVPTVDVKEINSAIGDMNYKVELIQSRYLQLNNEIEELRASNLELRKSLRRDFAAIPDIKRIEKLETESALLRSELAQIREDLSVTRRPVAEPDEDRQPTKTERLSSPWISISALGISILALLVSL